MSTLGIVLGVIVNCGAVLDKHGYPIDFANLTADQIEALTQSYKAPEFRVERALRMTMCRRNTKKISQEQFELETKPPYIKFCYDNGDCVLSTYGLALELDGAARR